MKIHATDKSGQIHTGQGIKNILICEEHGTPLCIVKETIIGDLRNYKILTPEDEDFLALTNALGYSISVSKIR